MPFIKPDEMLTRVAKPNYDALYNAAKQLFIWSLNKKQEFHTTCKTSCYDKQEKYEKSDKFDDRYNRYDRHDRQDRYDRYDRYERYEKFDKYNKYDRSQKYRRRSDWALDHDLQQKKVDFDLNKLKAYKKNFYEPHPDVLNRSEEEVAEFRKNHNIQIFGRNRSKCPAPIFKFEELNLPQRAAAVIRNLNYTTPTPIQSQAWPIALSGLDMVGVSQTGSGKTLGFVLPALIHIQNQPALEEREGPICLVMAPTRELAQQIYAVTLPFARGVLLKAACIYGGSSKLVQAERLRGAHLCIATPGRLMDFLNDGTINLHRCTYCVLDEADRLLDMGFEPQIKAVMTQVRPDKQTTMWSATWPKEVRNLAETFLNEYIGLKLGSLELAANPNITQHLHRCEDDEKRNLLFDILKQIRAEEDNKTLIFTKTKSGAENVARLLRREGYLSGFIHGDLSQHKRDELLLKFREGRLNILVGTSVISRGLDIHDIRYVINYDFPSDIEEYVHVVGRTARSNNPGTSHTFFTSQDVSHAADLFRVLEASKQEVPEFLHEEVRTSKAGAGFNRMSNDYYRRRPMRYRY